MRIVAGCKFQLKEKAIIKLYRTICWIQPNYLWILLVPIGIVVGTNLLVTFRTIVAAYMSATFRLVNIIQLLWRQKFFRGVDKGKRIMHAIRNVFILTSLLGLGFLLGFFPVTSSGEAQQYIFVLVNASAGKAYYQLHLYDLLSLYSI